MSGPFAPRIRLPAVALRFLIFCACLFPATQAFAHEVRPAYLELREEAPGTFDVLFKTPMRGDARLALDVSFSGQVECDAGRFADDGQRHGADLALSAIEPLAGQDGADRRAREHHDRRAGADRVRRRQQWVERLTPGAPQATIPARKAAGTVAATYLRLGVEHILLGFDHLLFVLALILIAPNTRQLVKAITAFTVAHSITLARQRSASSMCRRRRSRRRSRSRSCSSPLEILRARAGRAGIAARAPWIVAFAFGLLHGFGFAGALSEIGLPAGHIPVALLFFNLGVEIGQLALRRRRAGADRTAPAASPTVAALGEPRSALCSSASSRCSG